MFPEQRSVDSRVRVPALVLAAGKGVHVKDGVDTFSGTSLDDPIDQLEAAFFDLKVSLIVHEVAMIDGDSYAV